MLIVRATQLEIFILHLFIVNKVTKIISGNGVLFGLLNIRLKKNDFADSCFVPSTPNVALKELANNSETVAT
jgi:hypothetical protein